MKEKKIQREEIQSIDSSKKQMRPESAESTYKDSIQKKRMVILALGDSLAAGYGVTQKEAFPNQLEILLNRRFKKYQTTIINAGVSGSTSASAYTRLQKHLQKSLPHVVIIALGANDGLRGLSLRSLQDNLQKAIDLLKSKKIKPVLTGMKAPINYGQEYRKSFEKVFHDLSKKNNIPLVPFLLKTVGANPDLNLPDGIHPNTSGHQIIAQTILPYMLPFYK